MRAAAAAQSLLLLLPLSLELLLLLLSDELELLLSKLSLPRLVVSDAAFACTWERELLPKLLLLLR
ncbi:MAG: hypothetical protein V4653_02325 [Pseudomonadota bacterium]